MSDRPWPPPEAESLATIADALTRIAEAWDKEFALVFPEPKRENIRGARILRSQRAAPIVIDWGPCGRR